MTDTIAVDIRSNHNTGVARYGHSVLAAAALVAASQSMHLIIIVREGDEISLPPVTQYGHEILPLPGDEGFIRDSADLREVLLSRRVDLYYTSHYTVDRKMPVAFSFTIHDLTRWRFPELSYSDESFVARFGCDEMTKLREELANLANFDDQDDSDCLFTRYFKALNRDLASRATRIQTVSDSARSDIIKFLGVPGNMIDRIPCGVDTGVFRPRSSREIALTRDKYGLAEGPYLIFVGLTHKHKRFDWLVEQLGNARASFPSGSRIAAVGGHAEHSAIARRLVDLGLEDFVTFLGHVTDDDLAILYSGAAAWITASLNEGNNLPPLEALASGSQVIATDIPPLRETLGEFAHFYSPDDRAGLAQLASSALLGTWSQKGRGFSPPGWETSGALLVKSWQQSIADSRTARDHNSPPA